MAAVDTWERGGNRRFGNHSTVFLEEKKRGGAIIKHTANLCSTTGKIPDSPDEVKHSQGNKSSNVVHRRKSPFVQVGFKQTLLVKTHFLLKKKTNNCQCYNCGFEVKNRNTSTFRLTCQQQTDLLLTHPGTAIVCHAV